MRRRSTDLHRILNTIPWPAFDKLVLRCDGDKRVRTLPARSRFVALAYGHLAGAAGLRETAFRRIKQTLAKRGYA